MNEKQGRRIVLDCEFPYSTVEVAEACRVSVQTVIAAIRSGELRATYSSVGYTIDGTHALAWRERLHLHTRRRGAQ